MSVFLEVEHVTTYRYNKPVEFSPHRVMFRPRAAHDIRVLSATLAVSPHSTQYWMQDVFSNSVAIVEPRVPADTLDLHARFVIEHFGVKNLELPVAPEAENYPFKYTEEDRLDLAPFLPPQYPEDQPALRDWAGQFLPRRGTTHTRDILANINAAIRSDFQYQSRDAMGTQLPCETLNRRSGTCRDFALLMMEVVRGLGLAARFVSGYLYDQKLDTPEPPAVRNTGLQQGVRQIESRDEPLIAGAGATHAWLHVFLPGAGWVPYDPTNSLVGGTDLIRVAFTRKPEQAAPVSGSWFGDTQDFIGMDVSVSVRRIEHPAEQPLIGERPSQSPMAAGS
ncbi:transglutaminase domain-containing protein [Caballeronia arationis]|jgi:transglutaminase-like putative cysteine protease|uniref:Transglutaminase-like enzyme, putative cysteine protease n=1 Tax=Caballeronia arationis TaxID=1777142 RepID=A0A7Z7N2Z8_9BURK|nr:transglutaminase family protein [Caballeronia arationis]SAL01960.1 transglutaminase domain-containing protein [Caballeronia arationis]SOE64383.1 Transglutaminase-like enzyme, putative cysteine protease [Caballeronia arationis]